ncbi:MAG: shikimate dehydrogenase [bacterium]|nr:shikimate dehydrogenase [bacterium]
MKTEITGSTRLTAVLGSPIKHSLSPQMHNLSFQLLHLDYAYLAFEVDTSTLPQAVEALKVLNARGYNLTMPNKNLMCTLCDNLSQASRITGAVNTVVNDDGILTGHSTDGTGYMLSVKDAGFDIIGQKMTLLGAGGAATSIMVQAALDGMSEISVFCRPESHFLERTKKIISDLNNETNCKVRLFHYDDALLKRELSDSCILTNATSVGMEPHADQSLITDSLMFHKELIVSDIIYHPYETKLMQLAKQAGCSVFNGEYMLLYQGAEAFRLWTGMDMPVKEVKAAYFSAAH